MIRVLVSDLGQVLLPFDTRRVARAFADLTAHRPDAAFGVLVRLHNETAFGSGGVSGEEYHRRACEALGAEIDFDAFLVAFSDMFWQDDEVIQLMHTVRVERRWLMSNTNDLHWRFIRERYPEALAPFERHIVSHEIGLEKPDSRLFEGLIAESGAPAAAHLFVDDGAPNVAAARTAGMDAILHTDAASLRAALVERGLIG